MRSLRRRLAFMALLSIAGGRAFGWGCSGHQVVALIAEKQLSAGARRAALELLSGTPIDPALKRFCGRTTLGPLADSATWADDYRDQDPATYNWHFVDIPLNVTSKPGPHEYCEEGCVTDAIEKQIAVLRSATSPPEERAKALRFIVHFVGDMHQPLHDTSNNDRGGNCVPVSFLEWEPKQDEKGNYAPNLHSLWDNGIVERHGGIRRESHDADVARFASDLTRRYGTQIARWKASAIDVPAWAWEGQQLAVTVTYGKLPVRIVPEALVSVSSCADADNIGQRMLALHERVGPSYLAAVSPVIERQLVKAGARLARILNAALAPVPASPMTR
jgi:nuclease S1